MRWMISGNPGSHCKISLINIIKVMGILSEEATLLYFASLLSRDQLLKEKNSLLEEQILPFKS